MVYRAHLWYLYINARNFDDFFIYFWLFVEFLTFWFVLISVHALIYAMQGSVYKRINPEHEIKSLKNESYWEKIEVGYVDIIQLLFFCVSSWKYSQHRFLWTLVFMNVFFIVLSVFIFVKCVGFYELWFLWTLVFMNQKCCSLQGS